VNNCSSSSSSTGRCTNHAAALSVWALGKLGHTFGSNSGQIPSANSRQQQQQQQQSQQQKRRRLGKQQQQLLKSLQGRLVGMTARELTTSLYGLALQHCEPPADWAADALAAAAAAMQQQQLDPQGLSNLLYAVASLKMQPDRQWQISFWNALVQQVQRQLLLQQRQQQQQQAHSSSSSSSSSGTRTTGYRVTQPAMNRRFALPIKPIIFWVGNALQPTLVYF